MPILLQKGPVLTLDAFVDFLDPKKEISVHSCSVYHSSVWRCLERWRAGPSPFIGAREWALRGVAARRKGPISQFATRLRVVQPRLQTTLRIQPPFLSTMTSPRETGLWVKETVTHDGTSWKPGLPPRGLDAVPGLQASCTMTQAACY